MSKTTWFSFLNQAGMDELLIIGTIGEDNNSAESLIRQLQSLEGKPLNVVVNSPGGSAFDAISIYNVLRSRNGSTTCTIIGMAASAASIICMGAKHIRIHKSAWLMVHDPSGLTLGTSADMRQTADMLDNLGDTLIAIYADRSGQSKEVVRGWMDREAWFNAEEAVSVGLADEVVGDKASTSVAARFNLTAFRATPPVVFAMYGDGTGPTTDPHEITAKQEWHDDPTLAKRFTSNQRYINVRTEELKARMKVYGPGRADQARARAAAVKGTGKQWAKDPEAAKALAAKEWDDHRELWPRFSSKQNYIAVRCMEMDGSLKYYGSMGGVGPG